MPAHSSSDVCVGAAGGSAWRRGQPPAWGIALRATSPLADAANRRRHSSVSSSASESKPIELAVRAREGWCGGGAASGKGCCWDLKVALPSRLAPLRARSTVCPPACPRELDQSPLTSVPGAALAGGARFWDPWRVVDSGGGNDLRARPRVIGSALHKVRCVLDRDHG